MAANVNEIKLLVICAVKEAANKFAPGEYCMKFPNDVVCIKCGKKTGGILVRKEGKY